MREDSSKQIEIEQLRAGTRNLQNGLPADVATVVETMRANYEQHFANPSLAQGIGSKKGEIEAAFASMAALLQQLAAFDVTLKACTEQAAASAATAPASTATTVASSPSGLQVALAGTGAGTPAVGDTRAAGQKAMRDSTNDELLARGRSTRQKKEGVTDASDVGDGATK